MMWGPAVSRIAVDLALDGATDVVEAAEAFRMDRFDEHGTPPSVDPVALPLPRPRGRRLTTDSERGHGAGSVFGHVAMMLPSPACPTVIPVSPNATESSGPACHRS